MNRANRSTVGDMLRRSAHRLPDKTAIDFEDRSWTYRELDQAVDRIAGHLQRAGLGQGDRVCVFAHNSDLVVAAFLAALRAGIVHVPMNYNFTTTEIAYVLGQSRPSLIIADERLAPSVADSGIPVIAIEGPGSLLEWARDVDAPGLSFEPLDDDLAQIIYTSGTTALPKGSMMTHRGLVHQYSSATYSLDVAEHDVTVSALPMYHAAQMHCFTIPALVVGAYVRIIERPEIGLVLDLLESMKANSFFAPPTVWIGMLNDPSFADRDFSNLSKAYYGASIMPAPIIKKLRSLQPQIGFYNCFGQSEIGPLSTVLRPEQHDERPASCGRPVPFVDVRIVDENFVDVPVGESGEILYQSPQVCVGYWDKPEETAVAFVDGWFRSGDLGRWDAEGFLYVVDRVKDVINSGGVLVASREVEEALYQHDAVQEVAVIALDDEKWVEAISAIVVTRREVSVAELQDHVRQRLAPYKVPKNIFFVEDLPKNASGKLLKRELRTEFNSAVNHGTPTKEDQHA